MIEIFRNWIIAMLCLGILIVIIQLVIPKTNLRKYIYTLIGIITVITIISPIVDILKNEDVKESISNVFDSISNDNIVSVNSEGLENKKNELVEIQFIKSLKDDVTQKLNEKDIKLNDINISVDDSYNITKIEIKISKTNKSNLDNINDIVKYINSEYGIEYSKISVIEGDE